jgi:hypothetical protein
MNRTSPEAIDAALARNPRAHGIGRAAWSV